MGLHRLLPIRVTQPQQRHDASIVDAMRSEKAASRRISASMDERTDHDDAKERGCTGSSILNDVARPQGSASIQCNHPHSSSRFFAKLTSKVGDNQLHESEQPRISNKVAGRAQYRRFKKDVAQNSAQVPIDGHPCHTPENLPKQSSDRSWTASKQ